MKSSSNKLSWFLQGSRVRKVTFIYVLQQADNFTNSLGVLQQFANPTKFEDFGNRPQQQQQQNEGDLLTYITLP